MRAVPSCMPIIKLYSLTATVIKDMVKRIFTSRKKSMTAPGVRLRTLATPSIRLMKKVPSLWQAMEKQATTPVIKEMVRADLTCTASSCAKTYNHQKPCGSGDRFSMQKQRPVYHLLSN